MIYLPEIFWRHSWDVGYYSKITINFLYVCQSVTWLTFLLEGSSFGNLKDQGGQQDKPPAPVGRHHPPPPSTPATDHDLRSNLPNTSIKDTMLVEPTCQINYIYLSLTSKNNILAALSIYWYTPIHTLYTGKYVGCNLSSIMDIMLVALTCQMNAIYLPLTLLW